MTLTAHTRRHLILGLADQAAGTEVADLLTLVDDSTSQSGYGSSPIATAVATEYGNAFLHQTLLTLTAVPISLSDTHVGGGTQIYDFPAGRIYILGATASVAFTTTSALASTLNASSTLSWGVGSVVTGTQDSGVPIVTSQQDIVAAAAATSSATINVAGAAANSYGTAAAFDGTTTAINAYLNVGVGASDIDGDATVTASGVVRITWLQLGDY